MKPQVSPGSRPFPAGPHTAPLQTFPEDIEEDLPVSAQRGEGDRLPGGPRVQVNHLPLPVALDVNPLPVIPGVGRWGWGMVAQPRSCIKENTHIR